MSAEAPSFRTKHAEEAMVVVQTPSQVRIDGAHPKYISPSIAAVVFDSVSRVQVLPWRAGQRDVHLGQLESSGRTHVESQRSAGECVVTTIVTTGINAPTSASI